MPLCACGCGESVVGGNRYVRFHHLRVKTETHLEKLRAMLPRARAAISKETLRTTSQRAWANDDGSRRKACSERWLGGNNPLWNAAGEKLSKSGRVFIKVAGFGRDGWKPRARHVAETVLGRPLKTGEVVHHIDENKGNDANDNLLVCSDSYHKMLHRKMLKLKNRGEAWWLRS